MVRPPLWVRRWLVIVSPSLVYLGKEDPVVMRRWRERRPDLL
jgi:hypothetical protein